MPRYYQPSIAPTIMPGNRETAPIGAGPKTHKRGEKSNERAYIQPGKIVSTKTVVLSVDGPTIVARRAVWAVYCPMGRRVGQFPYNDRNGAEWLAATLAPVGPHRGYVLKEIIG